MKRLILILLSTLIVFSLTSAQFKSDAEPNVSQSMMRPSSGNNFLGFLNMDNFSMQHSVSLNYMTFGGNSLSLASYTNSMRYKISDPLNMRVDLTLQGSPFGNSSAFSQDNLSKVYISRAELNYQPAQNFQIQVQYRQLPLSYWGSYPYSPYYSMWGDK